MVNTDNSLLNEKYRPTTLDNYVGNENLKSSIANQLKNNDIQNKGKMFVKKSVFHIETAYDTKNKHIGYSKNELSLIVSLLYFILYKPKIVNKIISNVIGLVSISKPYISMV